MLIHALCKLFLFRKKVDGRGVSKKVIFLSFVIKEGEYSFTLPCATGRYQLAFDIGPATSADVYL